MLVAGDVNELLKNSKMSEARKPRKSKISQLGEWERHEVIHLSYELTLKMVCGFELHFSLLITTCK